MHEKVVTTTPVVRTALVCVAVSYCVPLFRPWVPNSPNTKQCLFQVSLQLLTLACVTETPLSFWLPQVSPTILYSYSKNIGSLVSLTLTLLHKWQWQVCRHAYGMQVCRHVGQAAYRNRNWDRRNRRDVTRRDLSIHVIAPPNELPERAMYCRNATAYDDVITVRG